MSTRSIADQRWNWWPLLPLYPYGRRRTLVRELIPDQLWSFEQLQGVFYVAVPIRMTVARVPGGLMLYAPVPPTREVLQALNPGGTCLGLRIPSCELSRELLQRTGPLATSSANPSGDPAATTPEQAALYFPDLPQLGPQPWPPLSGQASTVITWISSGRWKVLRRGAVMPEGIAEGG